MEKTVKRKLKSVDFMMGNINVGQPLPGADLEQISPFIMLHHVPPTRYEPGEGSPGVGPHPHRGFEPVSFIFQGEGEHTDSLGNHSIVGAGGVQWMTAGRGILHAEGLSPSFKEQGGTSEMIQLWINLPARLKMTEPDYQAFARKDIPFVEENNARINVIAGEFNERHGPVRSLTDILALTLEIEADGEANLRIPRDKNILLYQLQGESEINDTAVGDRELVVFENDGSDIKIRARRKSVLLFLAGDPIDEPMVSHGPFVMNTQTEILEAMRDYQMGKMGFLPNLARPESGKEPASRTR